jgi:hypothetical protein
MTTDKKSLVMLLFIGFGGLLRMGTDREMAETECETSNRILEILEEWNDYLKNNASYFQEPTP